MDELALYCFGVRVRVVDDAALDLCQRLRETFPQEFSAPSGAETGSVSYTVVADAPEETVEHHYAIFRDDVKVLAPATEEEAFRWLWHDIDAAVAELGRHRLFVRAGVVGWRGLAIVIPGRGTTGKSTLVAELVRRGAEFYSDVFAVLDEAGRVHPYARPLLDAERRQPQDLRLEREDTPREPLPIGVIVSGSYRPGTTGQPRILRGARSVWPLLDAAVRAREQAARLMLVAEHIVSTAVTLEAAWTAATDVAAHLLDMVDDAYASHAMGAAGTVAAGMADDLARVAAIRFRPGPGRPAPVARRLVAARYVRITDFLSPAEHQRMLEHALDCEEAFAESGIVNAEGGSVRDQNFRKSRTLTGSLLEEVWDLFEAPLRGILPAVRQELGMAWFPPGKIERQLTAHSRGGFFAPHVDTGHPIVAGRRISCIYYFFTNPRRFTGGELKLYDDWVTPTGSTAAPTHTTLTPIDNSVVFFPSSAFHEVCPVHTETDAFADSRFAVTIWFHEGG